MNYPIMLNLTDKSCVIVGGGKIATRKVSHLLHTGARITVISPAISEALQNWKHEQQIHWIEQEYNFQALANCAPKLVFAATNSVGVNQQVTVDVHHLGAWCNIADDAQSSDFHNMAVVKNPPITIAISTNGTSPVLLKIIKSVIEQSLGEEYSTLANWLSQLRDSTTLKTQHERQNLYENIVYSDILALLKAGQEATARELFNILVEKAVS